MTDAERVISGLEHCRPGGRCAGCPYYELFGGGTCSGRVREDALAMLRAQAEEIKNLEMRINRLHEGIREAVKWNA